MKRVLNLLALIVAGEAIFALPFVLPRVFRPTLLDALQIDNTQLGTAMSVYGLVAMVAYGLGGPLADRFSTRRMMALALVATAAGGLVLASLPTFPVLVALYAYWGLTTILLFWAGLLRATREWGGRASGRAFGLLDGGRGLWGALMASIALGLFALMVPEASATTDASAALVSVAYLFTGFTVLAGAGVWWFVPELDGPDTGPRWRWRDASVLVRNPALWFQALIVVCAYVGYKGTDDLSLLARDVLGASDVEAASVGTLAFWIRPGAALLAGLTADRWGGARTVAVCFALLLASDTAVVMGALSASLAGVMAAVVGTCAAVYALRGVYFALLDEAGIPLATTGTAVGIVSVLGYTPDVFFGPMMGVILDRSPGAEGHVHLFVVLAGFAAVGLLASLGFARVTRDEV